MKPFWRILPTIILIAFLIFCIIVKPEDLLRDFAITIFGFAIWSYIIQLSFYHLQFKKF